MPLEWTPALAIGVPEIDAQHQELFRRAGRLLLALRANDRSEVEPLLAYLGDYVVEHFATEEAAMAASGYPDTDGHRAAHVAFRREFDSTVAEFRRKGPSPLVALTLHNWLTGWLRRHVSGEDLRLGRWLVKRAV